MSVLHILGTRPNFVKASAVFHALKVTGIQQQMVHTGQHFDFNMSESFFQELKLPVPDISLDCNNSLNLSAFVAKVFEGIADLCKKKSPQLAIVYGDVTSTLAAAIACDKLDIPVAHVEAGLRSFDNTMPEETNRILVDHLSRFLFTTEHSANNNLIAEGIPSNSVYFVGNCMIDTLQRNISKALEAQPWKEFGLCEGHYLLFTMHRPSNVDSHHGIKFIAALLAEVGKIMPVLFPVHPRTMQSIKSKNLKLGKPVIFCEPLPYLKFIGLMAKASLVVTDSGGVQEETTWLNIPCLTLRPNTERPVTIEKGTNMLLPFDIGQILEIVKSKILANETERKEVEFWDGNSGSRIAQIIKSAVNTTE
jgi:UDP-N-acetylglucosamine 2-epimerase (non-hydrolysing)